MVLGCVRQIVPQWTLPIACEECRFDPFVFLAEKNSTIKGNVELNVLVTGANGFIGGALCSRLVHDNNIIGLYHRKKPIYPANIVWEQADLTDFNPVTAICKKYSPDVVIHCAGVAHQKVGAVDSATYMRVNSEATENLAKAAAGCNPDVCFIFLSSVSVYGEGPQMTSRPSTICWTYRVNNGAKVQKRKNSSNEGIGEGGECRPSSDYAVSKLDAERRLIALCDGGTINNLIILRLAPVYDLDWSFNLDRRVLAPRKLAYLRFGSGFQKMSALARPNLVDFISHILQSTDEQGLDSRSPIGVEDKLRGNDKRGGGNDGKGYRSDEKGYVNDVSSQKYGQNNWCDQQIFNVCDAKPYEFNTIIDVFKKSGIRPNRPVISVPLFAVWLATRIAGVFFPNKREWIHSCYNKLVSDLVFDNGRMMGMGFRPRHSLKTIFPPTGKMKN